MGRKDESGPASVVVRGAADFHDEAESPLRHENSKRNGESQELQHDRQHGRDSHGDAGSHSRRKTQMPHSSSSTDFSNDDSSRPGHSLPGRSPRNRALEYLSRREYSRAELSRKLMPFVDDEDALRALLDSLVKEGWLSDARFAESVVHRRAARVGANRIVHELKQHAVGSELIEEVSAQLRETEMARAQAVWRRKYHALPETPAERARQARFLAARGFSMAIISRILKGIEEDFDGS